MPELPEVETVRRGLAAALGFCDSASGGPNSDRAAKLPTLASLPQLQGWHFQRKTLRYPLPIQSLQALCGARLLNLERRSKYLLLYFGRETQLDTDAELNLRELETKEFEVRAAELQLCRVIVHLGMTGVLRILPGSASVVSAAPELGKHDHLWARLSWQGRDYYLLYNDVRRFGFWQVHNWEQLQSAALATQLGVEPLGLELYRQQAPLTLALSQQCGSAKLAVPVDELGELLYSASRGLQRELKPWLLEGKAVCGVGNIYCSESLWLAGLSPRKSVGRLRKKQAQALASALQQTIAAAIEAGGTTLKDFRSADGRPGYFQQELRAYGREDQLCQRSGCADRIVKMVQAQRATFYCPKCQR